jgi:hypothetical protein
MLCALSKTVCRYEKHVWLRASIVAYMCAAGCSSSREERFPVMGTVTFDGQPVPEGYITLKPQEDGIAVDAGKIVNGQFEFEAKVGAKRVVIEASRPGPIDPEMGVPTPVPYIPAKYNTKSTLAAEVKPGSDNRFDFPLTSDAKSR